MYRNDKRVVMTLDAGGTNFVFSAIQANQIVVDAFSLSAHTEELDQCLKTLVKGFTVVKESLAQKGMSPVAISFAFPGPADYENGIIGDLPNFPAFRGGIALGAYLQDVFAIPVYINNDGNLFAYGEALAGALPQLNKELEANGSSKKYKNLIGITFGTGFGSGVVINENLLTGDNGCGADIWSFRNMLFPNLIAEESVSIRAITRVYKEISGDVNGNICPKDVFEIAEGIIEGDKEAAIKSFEQFGTVAGDAIAHLQAFTDGIIVLGGGIVGAIKYIMPSLVNQMKAQLGTFAGLSFNRLSMDILDLSDEQQKKTFLTDVSTMINVPDSNLQIRYNSIKRSAITTTTLGTSQAVALGAYAFTLSELNKAQSDNTI